jgi:hypothetical protein
MERTVAIIACTVDARLQLGKKEELKSDSIRRPFFVKNLQFKTFNEDSSKLKPHDE